MNPVSLTPQPLGPPRVALHTGINDQAPRRQRAGKPKSRLGCLTCKTRRVKCDERKPVCARCERAQVACDGYLKAEPSRKIEPTNPRLHPLAPRASTTKGSVTTSEPRATYDAFQRAAKEFPRSFTGLPTVCRKDVPYFDLFRYNIAPDLFGYSYSELRFIIISEGLQDGYVRESILAIGALANAMSSPPAQSRDTPVHGRPSAIAPWSHQKITSHHHRASLLHHLKAVSGFRASIRDADAISRPRKILVTTLLLIVYEMLQGNLRAADKLLSCGLGVFRDSITLFQNINVTRDEIGDMEHVLPCLAIMGVFTHQLNSSWTHILHLRSDPEFKFPDCGIDTLTKVYSYWGRFYTLAVSFLCQKAHDNDFSVFEAVARRENFLSCLHQWKSILESYFNSCETRIMDKRALRLILIHWQVIWISFSCSLDRTGVAFDTFTDEFRDILCRSIKFIEDDLADAPLFMTFGEGIFMPLLCVVTCCRDHDLRMTAAAVAYELPWREGTWDTKIVLLGQLGSVLMEEKGRDDSGFIPPSSRWHWRGGVVSPKSRRMTSAYLRHVPDEQREVVTKQLSIDLDRWPDICSAVGCQKDHAVSSQMIC